MITVMFVVYFISIVLISAAAVRHLHKFIEVVDILVRAVAVAVKG